MRWQEREREARSERPRRSESERERARRKGGATINWDCISTEPCLKQVKSVACDSVFRRLKVACAVACSRIGATMRQCSMWVSAAAGRIDASAVCTRRRARGGLVGSYLIR
ncbi:hypothetical protein EVAR_58849_1 [Eumeta japonica]|uniref:Uncharacterized protein n=1 Tax=Eumeta variegata TaxID=151549 RepID=A0A4C1Y8V9_EUMVA|nr:hypothetical protein EVAR_58849_1 [Eumeta japonica]